MIPRPFDDITKQDIDNLVAEARPERRVLEYKQELPNLGLDQDKIEFLADVCSFANAAGGDILYGVVDKREGGQPTGIPESAPGVSATNLGQVILRLEQTARSNIDPKIPGFQMRDIPGFTNGPVVVARIPKSYVGPHLVRNKDWGRFYSRSSNGKHILDAGEIRSAYALSETLPEKVRRFRAERLSAIVAGETSVGTRPGPKLVLHALPLRSLDPLARVALPLPTQGVVFKPLFAPSPERRYNLDGVLFYYWAKDRGDVCSYVQLFRSGAFEAVECRVLGYRGADNLIFARELEDGLVDALDGWLAALNGLQVGAPVFILITLLGVYGYRIQHVNNSYKDPVDRDTLMLPDVLVEDFTQRAADKLRDPFDALWQAGGWERCFNYDEQGKRLPNPSGG